MSKKESQIVPNERALAKTNEGFQLIVSNFLEKNESEEIDIEELKTLFFIFYERYKDGSLNLDDGQFYGINVEIPELFQTAFQQYLCFFKNYLKDVKGVDLYFEVLREKNDIRIIIEKNDEVDYHLIAEWFNDYLRHIQEGKDNIHLKFEKETEDNEAKIIMAELKNQIRNLESNMEILTVKNELMDKELIFLRKLSMSFSSKMDLVSKHPKENEIKLKLKLMIGKGKIKSVIEDLINKANQQNNQEFYNELCLLFSKLNHIELENRIGKINQDDYLRNKTQIEDSALKIIDEIELNTGYNNA